MVMMDKAPNVSHNEVFFPRMQAQILYSESSLMVYSCAYTDFETF